MSKDTTSGTTEQQQGDDAASAAAQRHVADDHRRQWFATFAPAEVMPLLERAARYLKRRGMTATASLGEHDGRLVAELRVLPRGLPAGAPPPRLLVTASRSPRLSAAPATHERPLLVEYSGTFPHAGATGGFGAEIDYDTILPEQLREQVNGFIALVTR